MDASHIESALLIFFLLVPVCMLVVFYVVSVMLVATAMVYVKAGRPAWLSLVPLYSFVELLDIAGLSVWWGLMVPALTAISVASVFFCTDTTIGFWISMLLEGTLWVGTLGFMGYVYYYLSRAFGESGWYALGYIFLPFIFFPLLGFGTAKFKGSKKKSADKQRNKLIVTGLIVVSTTAAVAFSIVFVLASLLTPLDRHTVPVGALTSQLQTCYRVVDGHIQHVASGVFIQASPASFVELTNAKENDYCYSKDATSVFFEDTRIADADATTFKVLGDRGLYAADAKRVYWGAKIVPDADPKNFTELGYGYAKGRKTVFYLSTGTGKDWDLQTIEGADVATFTTAPTWNGQFDASDKNQQYRFGVALSTTTRQ